MNWLINVSDDYLRIMKSPINEVKVKFELLDKDFNVLEEVTEDVSYDDIGSISFSTDSDIRSQFSITFNNHNGKFTWGQGNLLWVDLKMVRLYIGFAMPNGEIEYALQGVYILTSPETISSPTECSTTVSGQDLWYLVSGNFGVLKESLKISPYVLKANGDYVVDEKHMPIRRMEYDENGTALRPYRITNYIVQYLKQYGITKMIIDECDTALTTELSYDIGENIGQVLKDLTEKCYTEQDDFFYECFFDKYGYFRFQKVQNPNKIPPCATYKKEDFTAYAGSKRALDESTLYNDIVVLGGGGESIEFRAEETIDEDAYEKFSFGDSTKAEMEQGTMKDITCNYLGNLELAQGDKSVTIGDETRVVGDGTYKSSGSFTSRWFKVDTSHRFKSGNVSWISSSIDKDESKAKVERVCTVCGYRDTMDSDVHSHIWSGNVVKTDEYCHYYACQYSFCDEVHAEPHKFNPGWDHYDAAKGIKTLTCKICGYTKTAPYALKDDGHTHEYELAPNPTYPENSHTMACKHGCQSTTSISLGGDDTVESQSHCFINSKSDLESGNYAKDHKIISYPNSDGSIPGVRVDTCRCGYSRVVEWTKAVDEGGYEHTEHHVDEDAPWVYEKGGSTHWQRCNYFLGCPEHMNEAAHTWNEGEIIKKPTETEAGIIRYTCTVCGATNDTEVTSTTIISPKTDDGHEHHMDKPAYSADANYHWYICDECGEPFLKGSHKWDTTKTPVSDAELPIHHTISLTVQYADKDKNIIKQETLKNGDSIKALSEGDELYPYMRYIVNLSTDNTTSSPAVTNVKVEIETLYQPWVGHPYSIQKIGKRTLIYNDGQIDSNID